MPGVYIYIYIYYVYYINIYIYACNVCAYVYSHTHIHIQYICILSKIHEHYNMLSSCALKKREGERENIDTICALYMNAYVYCLYPNTVCI